MLGVVNGLTGVIAVKSATIYPCYWQNVVTKCVPFTTLLESILLKSLFNVTKQLISRYCLHNVVLS